MNIRQYLTDLARLVNTDSGQDCREGITRIAQFFRDRFDEMGWNTAMHDLEPDTGACLICTNRPAEHYDVMLIGHTDTVFPKGTAAARPFRTDEEKAYGPGVADMKNGCLLMYHILHDLPPEISGKLSIAAVFNPDEEIGSRYSGPVYYEVAKKAKYVYVYESQGTDGTHCIERKGSLSFSVVIHGKAGHVGYTFTNGALSAVVEAARWVLRISELQSVEHNLNVNVTRLYGGDKMNVVPDMAGFSVNMRIPNRDEVSRVKAVLEELTAEAAQRGYTAEIPTFGASDPLTPSPEGYRYAEHLKEVAASVGQEFCTKFRGGLSDANRIARLGPICIDGLGPMGSGGHAEGEYMRLDSIVPAYELSLAMLRDLAENK